MVSKNGLGKKVIGAALSMAMAITAVPAMTSLACGHDDGDFMLSAAVPVDKSTLSDRLEEVVNYYYQYESVIPNNTRLTCENVFFIASRTIRDPYANYAQISHSMYALDDVYETVEMFAARAAAKQASLDTLYDLLAEMSDFGNTFSDEIDYAADLDTYIAWVQFGWQAYCNSDFFTKDDIDALIESLTDEYISTINAIDAASAQAIPEDEPVAPDYGMDLDDEGDGFEIEHQDDFTISPDFQIDHQDSFTIDGEQPADEDESVVSDSVSVNTDSETIGETSDENVSDSVSVDPVSETNSETVSVDVSVETISETNSETIGETSAPATQVLGAARDRRAIAESIVENLYNNVLNRASDEEGRNFWVNTILSDESSIDMVVAGFVTSAEFTERNLSDDEFVALLYKTMFNRAPSASEKNLWMAALHNGASRDSVVNCFITSTEFEHAAASMGL
ncbi:MAG: DUF4214 domain-containing protein [Clostridiales bacterium]|nr:DUF4214 domain-containing protein [Clostridiales bacterium]